MRAARVAAGALAAALVWAAPATAATKTVSFDDLPPDTEVSTQYQASHGVYWKGPPDDNGYLPVTRDVGDGVAHSGEQVADLLPCLPGAEKGPRAQAIGRLTTSASTVIVYVGSFGPGRHDIECHAHRVRRGWRRGRNGRGPVTEGQPFTEQLSVSSLSPNIATFEVTGEVWYAYIAMDDVTITTPDAPPPPDIALSVSSDPVNVRQGDAVDVPLTITRLNGSNGNVSLTVSGLPAGMGARCRRIPCRGPRATRSCA